VTDTKGVVLGCLGRCMFDGWDGDCGRGVTVVVVRRIEE